MHFSQIGQNLIKPSGVDDLMNDLYKALYSGNPDLCQLNGGSPALLPEITGLWKKSMENLLETDFDSLVGTYTHPRGDQEFIRAFVNYINGKYGWGITEKNVATTQGGQMAFFILFNILGGSSSEGSPREILFPLCPDYIGYQAQDLHGGVIFSGNRPQINLIGDHEYKYSIDMENLHIGPNTAALCLSRPTNPTGNVVTDDELRLLAEKAEAAGIPLLVDSAYGPPFPNICFADISPMWNENIVISMSLSKIGLPGTRTGIIIANEDIISAIVSTVTTSALCPNNFGQKLVLPYLENGIIDTVCRDVITPFYRSRSLETQAMLRELFDDDIPWRVHKSEGAMFLWLWFEDMPITSRELYERCRERGCFINPGHHFFFALKGEDANWKHAQECVRISFTQPHDITRKGLSILADEVKKAYTNR